jgi:hypothetical protein
MSRVALALVASVGIAHGDPPRGLQGDIMLHPGDAFTGETLHAGDWIYNQAVMTLPLPSWAWIGVTDWLTAEIDLLPLLGGFFIEPHLPVPSLNLRFKLYDHLAYETMAQYQWRPFDDQLGPESFVHIVRDGLSWFHRVNVTLPVARNFRVHASLGATYARSLTIENQNRTAYRGRHFENLISPDASLGLDWRPLPWLSLHSTGSFGTTFVYLDNVPRKAQVTLAFRAAPFESRRHGLLGSAFFRCMRIEASTLYIYFRDADESMSLPVPIFPYFYWQG